MSEPITTVYTTPPTELLTLLNAHLPHSLPLLRRLQFTRFPGGITEHTRILFTAAPGDALISTAEQGSIATEQDEKAALTLLPPEAPVSFTAAYLDLSRGPETELWMFCSLESLPSASGGGGVALDPAGREASASAAQAVALLHEVRRLRDEYRRGQQQQHAELPRRPVLVGTLGAPLRAALLAAGCILPYDSDWDKWVFRLETLPLPALRRVEDAMAREGLRWGRVRREDVPLVLSRTKIPRKERTLVLLPSTTITLDDETPIAWCFLGPDGSLSSLHCEEQYRGRGFAKAVAVKIMLDHLRDYGGDGYCAADVAPDNVQSQGVCRSLGGKILWRSSWSTIDLDRLPEPR
ncbi:hypothetical protein JX265_005393 [Neoarthrinium moseri]|uniref:GCN5-related N-acetyltransferase Rv2170-like domain-containing protein n=1 Tax=Neoarthrinium moseri TaxID=1658444 RepID=A0A9P9WNN5_9PEZI|nr:hypothetical protein JX266_008548 [Neoarthrinium moseri]KAI1872513.1 hypothetical protein JX265_005393 [Neoarthrinium moseri]